VVAIGVGVQDSEEVAFARLYERHSSAVYAYARRRSDVQVAEEVTARVFMVAWRRRAAVPAEDALPWLYGVARRVLAEERRSERRRRSLGQRLRDLGGREAEPVAAAGDGVLGAALARLSDADREVLLLRYWEDLSPEQLVVALGCSRSALAVRLHRARRRLAGALGDPGTPVLGHEEVGAA
jgi:RNA polymerase sigma-70 factor (ECF subfamily)